MKIYQKMMSRREGILASIFIVFVDFWNQVGKENGTNIDPKRHPKNDLIKNRFWEGSGEVLGG